MQPLGPTLDPARDEVRFVLQPDARSTPVRVWYHLRDEGADPSFRLEAGRWVGQPVLFFPAEAGSAYDAEQHGIIHVLAPAIEAGRIKV